MECKQDACYYYSFACYYVSIAYSFLASEQDAHITIMLFEMKQTNTQLAIALQ